MYQVAFKLTTLKSSTAIGVVVEDKGAAVADFSISTSTRPVPSNGISGAVQL